MTDLERRLAEAAPTWPEPSADVERRTRAALGWDAPEMVPVRRPWWRRRHGTGRLLLAGAVLVVGGAGFVGSNLVRGLLDHAREVVVVDNLLSAERDEPARRRDAAHRVPAHARTARCVRGWRTGVAAAGRRRDCAVQVICLFSV